MAFTAWEIKAFWLCALVFWAFMASICSLVYLGWPPAALPLLGLVPASFVIPRLVLEVSETSILNSVAAPPSPVIWILLLLNTGSPVALNTSITQIEFFFIVNQPPEAKNLN